MSQTPQQPSPSTTILLDVAAVVLFCVLGGLSHSLGQPDAVLRIVNSIWPFLASLVVAHAAVLLARVDGARVIPGIPIWLVTVGGAMVLRALTGQGTATAFIIVSAAVLALLLIGWRIVAALVRRRRVS